MKVATKIFIKLSANGKAQHFLERIVSYLQFIMGIGAGGSVNSSGEKAIFEKLKLLAEPPFCILDVGANKGQFIDLAIQELGETNFYIHAFEPGKYSYSKLSDNLQKASNVKLNNCALGKNTGEVELFYDKEGSEMASLTKRKLDHLKIQFENKEIVKLDTLENYCSAHEITKINLLKLDVEGHELDVLSGAKQLFRAGAIDLISFEFGGTNIDTRTYFRDFFYFLSEYEMSIFRITPSRYLVPISSYREIHEQFRTTNFLAVRKGISTP